MSPERVNQPEKIPPPKPATPPAAIPAPESPSPTKPAKELTPEEQMERFAEDLKENDWGHQPC